MLGDDGHRHSFHEHAYHDPRLVCDLPGCDKCGDDVRLCSNLHCLAIRCTRHIEADLRDEARIANAGLDAIAALKSVMTELVFFRQLRGFS